MYHLNAFTQGWLHSLPNLWYNRDLDVKLKGNWPSSMYSWQGLRWPWRKWVWRRDAVVLWSEKPVGDKTVNPAVYPTCLNPNNPTVTPYLLPSIPAYTSCFAGILEVSTLCQAYQELCFLCLCHSLCWSSFCPWLIFFFSFSLFEVSNQVTAF